MPPTPNPVTVTWCSECGARVVLSHDPVPFWVNRAMERIRSLSDEDSNAGLLGSTGRLCPGLWNALTVLREEAAKDNVNLDET